MLSKTSLKRAMLGTTALIGATLLTSTAASAAACPAGVPPDLGSGCSMSAGATLTVAAGGSINAVTTAVTVSGVAATSINNSGAIQGSGVGGGTSGGGGTGGTGGQGMGVVLNSGSITSGISNNASGTIEGLGGPGGSGFFGGGGGLGVGVDVNGGTLSGITNGGLIEGLGGTGENGEIGGSGGQGLGVDVSGGTLSGITNNTGGTIEGIGGAAGLGPFGGGGGQGVGLGVNGGTLSGVTNNTGGTIEGLGGAGGLASSGGGGGGGGGMGVVVNSGLITSGITNGGLLKGIGGVGGQGNSGNGGGGGQGVGVLVTGGTLSGITNNAGGVIEGLGGAGGSGFIGGGGGQGVGVLVTGGSITGGITNSGLIEGLGGAGGSGLGGGGGQGLGVSVNGGSFAGGITNNAGGTISGGATGINVATGAKLSGGIADSGLIKGGTYGIFLAADGTISGAVTAIAVTGTKGVVTGGISNNGLIQGTTVGIGVSAGGVIDSVTNNSGGTISGGANGTGIRVAGSHSDISGGVSNSGKIINSDYAIYVDDGGKISGGVTNTATGTISGAIAGISLFQGSIGTGSGGVNNRGLIKGGTFGLWVDNASTIANGVVNQGGATISGGATGIYVDGTSKITGGITNGGLIEGGTYGINNAGTISGPAVAILVNSGGDILGGINNTGKIVSPASAAIEVKSTAMTGGIANSGSINGVIGIKVSNGAISGGITNSGTINGGSGPAIDLIGLTGSTPINLNGGQVIGAVTDDTPANGFSPVTIGGNFTTDGDFTVSSVKISAGNTFTIAAANTVSTYTMPSSAGGTLQFGVNGNTAGNFGTWTVTNAPLNLTGLTIKILTGVSPALTVGEAPIEIASGIAGTAITGGPVAATNVSSNSSQFKFQIEEGAGALDNELFLSVLAGATPSGSGLGVYNILEGLSGTTNPQLLKVINNINSAGGNAALNNDLSAAQPTVDGAVFESGYELMDTVMGLLDDRLNVFGSSAAGGGGGPGHADAGNVMTADAGTNETGMAAGSLSTGRSAWGQFFGQAAHQQAGAGNTSFSATTGGFAMGADTETLVRNAVVGAALSYGDTFINSKNASTDSTNIDSYQLSLYGDYDLGDHNFVRGMAAYALNTDSNSRHNVGGVTGLTAEGNYDASEYALELKAGRHYSFGDTLFTPGVMARYLGYDAQNYTETGAGGADLHVTQNYLSLLEVGPTVEAAWNYQNADGSRIVPALHAGYRYDLIGDSISTTSSFTGGGASFATTGARPDRSRFNLGGDAAFYTTDRWEFRAAYDMDLRQDYVNNSGVVRVTYRF